MLAIARQLLSLGLCVIPVPRAHGRRFDGKTPALAWREYQSRLPTDDELIAWFDGGMPINLAIVTGAVSGIVVVDLDSPEAQRWWCPRFPYSGWQVRTARGWHLYFQHPGVLVRNRARIETGAGRLALDVRGDGGYVIGPGSLHGGGAEYRFAGDWSQPRESVPRFWPGWLARPQTASVAPPRVARVSGDVIERARAYLAATPKPEIGQGSDATTFRVACRLVRGFRLAPNEATLLMWAWAGNRAGWDYDWIARKVAHAELYGTEPLGGLVS